MDLSLQIVGWAPLELDARAGGCRSNGLWPPSDDEETLEHVRESRSGERITERLRVQLRQCDSERPLAALNLAGSVEKGTSSIERRIRRHRRVRRPILERAAVIIRSHANPRVPVHTFDGPADAATRGLHADLKA